MNNKEIEYHRCNHIVYKCTYHVVFCPKYRRKILKNGIDEELKLLIYKFAEKKNFNVLEMEVMEDHVHLLLDMYPEPGPLEIIKQLKYLTAKELKIKFPEINKKLPNLWTRSCFISTVGGAPLEIVKQYIESQKNK